MIDPLFIQRMRRHGGGGGGNQAQAIQNAPAPAASPPVTLGNSEVIQAEQDTARQALMKKGTKSTVHAGNTGGWFPGGPGAAPGANPNLGGPTSFKNVGKF